MKTKSFVVASRIEGSDGGFILWIHSYTSTLGLVKAMVQDLANFYAAGEGIEPDAVPFDMVATLSNEVCEILSGVDLHDGQQVGISMHGMEYIIRTVEAQ